MMIIVSIVVSFKVKVWLLCTWCEILVVAQGGCEGCGMIKFWLAFCMLVVVIYNCGYRVGGSSYDIHIGDGVRGFDDGSNKWEG